MMNNSQKPVARHSGLVVQEMPGEVLVYDMDSNKAHCLNETAALVWRSCDGNNTVEDIVRSFERNAGAKVSEDLVWLAIDQLNSNGLLADTVESKLAGQSRREVLKKIGFASVIALPVIASLVAPQSVLAFTSCTCNPGQPLGCTPQVPAGCGGTCNPGGVCVAP